ncbi:MAG: tRNA (N6-threonylcarbamoyladenosine(37)-N6)-methyltransferase TrmO [Peptococcaceae bacterium]|jgi:tRNA-Thr(GGU) m(6)t(6)A37 methyltransferase TsaA|nr:tRNA (N6-threonylcarbamoyladenosine(37)-N6)-methyltransferase TrmO [Peptococcaceae bacterium]
MLQPIAHIRSDYGGKFGIPRQSGLAPDASATIGFEPEYSSEDAVRGLEQYSHLWLIWGFSENAGAEWAPTVRPPRMGGNQRLGVFATRSPFRPNKLGLSAVKLMGINFDKKHGPQITVTGADLMDGSPIYDIKPYIPYTDCIEGACAGFAADPADNKLDVVITAQQLSALPQDKQQALRQSLALDPRPAYHEDPHRVYGMLFAGYDVRFSVAGRAVTVCEIERLER